SGLAVQVKTVAHSILTASMRAVRNQLPTALSALPTLTRLLPAIMRERPVGLGHPVGVFLLFDGIALALGGQNELRRQALCHSLFGPSPSERDEPAHGERGAPVGADFH